MSTLPNLHPSKTSWDYIKEANSKDKKIIITKPEANKKLEYWRRYSVGTKFLDKNDMKWYRKTESDRVLLEKDDPLLNPIMPLFCPKCGKIMKKNRDQICFFHTKGCLNCHVKEKAEKNEEPNIHEFKRKLKIIQNKILKEQENKK